MILYFRFTWVNVGARMWLTLNYILSFIRLEPKYFDKAKEPNSAQFLC